MLILPKAPMDYTETETEIGSPKHLFEQWINLKLNWLHEKLRWLFKSLVRRECKAVHRISSTELVDSLDRLVEGKGDDYFKMAAPWPKSRIFRQSPVRIYATRAQIAQKAKYELPPLPLLGCAILIDITRSMMTDRRLETRSNQGRGRDTLAPNEVIERDESDSPWSHSRDETEGEN